MRTSVELEGPIVERPAEQVFAFVSDLANSPSWGRTKKTVKDPGSPDGVGARFQEETRLLGEKVHHQSEIRTLNPPTDFSYTNRFTNGVMERTRIVIEPVEGGTRIDIATEIEFEQIPQVLSPFVSLFVKQRIGGRFRKLEQEFKPPDRSVNGAAVSISIGAILLATAGLGFLIGVLPEGAWRNVVALTAAALVLAGAAFITWKASRRVPPEGATDPTPPQSGQTEVLIEHRPGDSVR